MLVGCAVIETEALAADTRRRFAEMAADPTDESIGRFREALQLVRDVNALLDEMEERERERARTQITPPMSEDELW